MNNNTLLILLVQFLRHTIVDLQPELVIILGDARNIHMLDDVSIELGPVLRPTPVVRLCDDGGDPFDTSLMVQPMGSKHRLTIVALPSDRMAWVSRNVSKFSWVRNHLVLVLEATLPDETRMQLAREWMTYNGVILELSEINGLLVIPWIVNYFDYIPRNVRRLPVFRGPASLFNSQHINALSFQHKLRKIPSISFNIIYRILKVVAPYEFYVRVDGGKVKIVSHMYTMCKTIADTVGAPLVVSYHPAYACDECLVPLAIRGKHDRSYVDDFTNVEPHMYVK